MFKNLKILDTTLRDGEQTPGVSLTTESKLLIARKIDSLGVDIIEAGSAITSEGERASIKEIASAGLNAEICSYCRIRKEDIDAALKCDVDSIHLVVPVSDLHIQQKLKKDRDSVREMAVEMTEYAKSHGLIVELSGEDASRADLEYLKSVYNAGIDAGADRLCFCDTVGILLPERTYDIFSDLSRLRAPISVHCHNDFGMATANTISALRAGAKEAHVTINGIGERAGNTSLEEVVMVLYSLYLYKSKIDIKSLYTTSRLVSMLSGVPVAPNKSIVGGNAFTHEAGIHVHGLLANTATYEPITPELVGRERRIVLGKHAGRSNVILSLKEMGIPTNEKQIDEIVRRTKELGDTGKYVSEKEFQAIVEVVLGICEEKVKLEELVVVAGTVKPMALVRLRFNGDHVEETETGKGPVDAAIEALKKAISKLNDVEISKLSKVKLEEYHVDAMRGGTDALVEVQIKLSYEDKKVTAYGAETDIIKASVRAVLAGVNKMIYKKNKEE